MSGDVIRDFFEKRDEVEKLRKAIDTRLNAFLAVLGHLRGYDNEERERWRSVNTTTMAVPNHTAGNPLIEPKDWLTLEELGSLLDSWHVAIGELGKAWRLLSYHDQQRFIKDEPPDH
jgi:hypothetical protein